MEIINCTSRISTKLVFGKKSTQSTALTGDSWCMICGGFLESWDYRCPNMFSTSMQYVGNRISYSLSFSDAVMKSYKPHDLPSLKICCKCCHKLEETCRIEAALKKIREEISFRFDSTMKRWKQNFNNEELLKSQRSNLLGLSTSPDSLNLIEMSDLGIKIIDARSIANSETSPLFINNESTLESNNVIGMTESGIKIVETRSIAADADPLACHSTKASAAVLTVMQNIIANDPPALGLKVKLVKTNLIAAGNPPLKIRIKDPSSINSSVPKTSSLLNTVDYKHANILPKTLTARVLRTITPLSKEGTAFSKAAPAITPPAFLSEKIKLPRIVIKRSNFIKFGTIMSSQKLTTTPVQQTLHETQSDRSNDDFEINHSQAELDPTDLGNFEEDIKPEPSQLQTFKEDPKDNSLISKQKRKHKITVRGDSNDSISLSNRRKKWRRVATDHSSDSQNCSANQKRAVQEPEVMPMSTSPQPKKLKLSPRSHIAEHSEIIDASKIKKGIPKGGLKKIGTAAHLNLNKTPADGSASTQKKMGRPKGRKSWSTVSEVLTSASEKHSRAGSSHSGSDIPLRRGAFKQASERLHIIANYRKYQRSPHRPNGVLKNEQPAVAGPAKKRLNLKECQIVLMDVMTTKMQNLEDESCISNDGAAIITENAVLRLDKGVKSDFDFVCNGIQKVVLESPPINLNKRGSRSTFLRMDDTCNDMFDCDICNLDFLKLDDLRNHIEQDHFAPTY